MTEETIKNQHIVVTGLSGAKISICFRDLVDWSNEGIYCINSSGLLVYANDRFCKNLGYEVSEVVGNEITPFIYDEANLRLAKTKLELRKRGLSDSYDIQMKRKNGDPAWMRLSGRPIIDKCGEFMGTIVIDQKSEGNAGLEEELIYAKEDLESKVIARTGS